MQRVFIVLGSLNAFLSVALGAFGAHGLKGRLSEDMLNVYQTGVHYHMIHSLGLLAVGILSGMPIGGKRLRWAGILMQAGIILFSGSLYALSLSGNTPLGIITPFGGVAFLAAWLLLAAAAWKKA